MRIWKNLSIPQKLILTLFSFLNIATKVQTSKTDQQLSTDMKSTIAQSPTSPNKTIDVFLKFAFQMDSIVVNLFSKRDEGLASFGIYFLSLKGQKLADDSLSTSIVLCDVQLDDIRPNRENKLTRFMKRRQQKVNPTTSPTKSIEPATSMIDVICNMRDNDIFLELRVSSFELILSLDYIMKISNFFQLPEENKDDEIKVAVKPTPGTNVQKGKQILILATNLFLIIIL